MWEQQSGRVRSSQIARYRLTVATSFTQGPTYPFGVPRRGLIISALAGWLGGSLLLSTLGLRPRDAALASLVVLVQLVTGALVWIMVRRSGSGKKKRGCDVFEILGMGLALGTLIALISGVLLNSLLPWSYWWVVPSILVGALWLILHGRVDISLERVRFIGPLFFGLALGVLGLAVNLLRYPLDWSGLVETYHRDIVFFEALGTSIAKFGPNDSIFMAGADIRYHWFAYGWAGQVSESIGAEPFAVLTRVLPVVALVATVLLVVSWTRSMTNRVTVSYLAVGLVVAGGYVGAVNGTILNFDSPSQAFTTMWLMAFVVAALAFLADTNPWRTGLVVIVLAVGLAGGKVSAAVVALGGLGFLMVVGFMRREPWANRLLVITAFSGLAILITSVLVLVGNASGGDLQILSWADRASTIQGLNSSPGERGIVIGTATLIVAAALRWIGVGWLMADRTWRWRPETLLGIGMGIVGVLAIIGMSQGLNETWFALSASAPLGVLSAVGLGVAWQRIQNRRVLTWSLVSGLLITPVVAVIWAHGWPGNYIIRFWAPWVGIGVAIVIGVIAMVFARRFSISVLFASAATAVIIGSLTARAMPVVASGWIAVVGQPSATDPVDPALGDAIVRPDTPSADAVVPATESALTEIPEPRERPGWTDRDLAAAVALRELVRDDDIIVTNEVLSFMVPALTGTRTFISGATYQNLYGSRETVPEIPERVGASMNFAWNPTNETFDTLCSAGATYGWFDNDLAQRESWEPYATIVYQNDSVTIVKINGERCGE